VGSARPARGLDRHTAGLIVAPGAPEASAPRLEECGRRNIRVASVAGDIPGSPHILSVSVDAVSVGALAGELLGRFVPLGGEVAVVASSVATGPHAEAMRGFSASLARFGAPLRLVDVIESHVDERETHRRVQALLRAHRRLRGLYVGTEASRPVLQAARDEGRLAGLAVVTTDLHAELFDWIRSGTVAATIYERPLTQGHVALQLLYQYVQTGVLPLPHRQAIAPYAVMSSNLDIVLQRLAIARAAAVACEHGAALADL
jgi:LacI family transcriptional regulator